MGKQLSLVAAFTGLFGCSTLLTEAAQSHTPTAAAPLARSAERARPRTIVLVAIDGARWQDVFLGTDRRLLDEARLDARAHARTADQLVPNLSALARSGLALGAPGQGAPFLASGPNFVSLPGYTELLTGHPATCQENDCEPPSGTVFEADWPGRAPLALFASWERLGAFAQHVPDGVVVSAGRPAPGAGDRLAALGPMLAALAEGEPASAEYRVDLQTGAAALAHLEREAPPFAFVSLGDTDEAAHAGDYGAYLGALGRADAFVGELVALGEAWRGQRDLVVLVTADHGRSDGFRDHGRDHPESARTFLIAGGGPIPARGWVAAETPRHLADVAPTIAWLAGLTWEPSGANPGAPIAEVVSAVLPDAR